MTRHCRRCAEVVMGIVNLHRASGMHDAEQCWAFLFVALGLADRSAALGVTRAEFLMLAGEVYDQVRSSLSAGAQS